MFNAVVDDPRKVVERLYGDLAVAVLDRVELDPVVADVLWRDVGEFPGSVHDVGVAGALQQRPGVQRDERPHPEIELARENVAEGDPRRRLGSPFCHRARCALIQEHRDGVAREARHRHRPEGTDHQRDRPEEHQVRDEREEVPGEVVHSVIHF